MARTYHTGGYLLCDRLTMVEQYVPLQREVAEIAGVSPKTVIRVLNAKTQRLGKTRFLVKLCTDKTPWQPDNVAPAKISNADKGRKSLGGKVVVCMDITTRETQEFKSIREAYKRTGLSYNHVYSSLNSGVSGVGLGVVDIRWIFRWKDNAFPDAQVLENHATTKTVTKTRVLLKVLPYGLEVQYRDAAQCAAALGMQTITVKATVKNKSQKTDFPHYLIKGAADTNAWLA